MPLGPVFNAELLTTARRPRYYIVRFIYGLIILLQIYLSYQSNALRLGDSTGQLRISDMADFGQDIFVSFAILQAIVVLLLTPALVGGAIADEKQRKTLHYLLASQLTSAEIVLGKLAARLLQVVVLVALGLPIVSLIALFGGIDIQLLLLSYGATFTTIYFLATASILVSVVSRRPREAISMIYILELGWLIGPPLLMGLLQYGVEPWPTIGKLVNPVLQYVAVTSPIFPVSSWANTSFSGPIAATLWGMGLQVVYGTLFVILASIRLRPAYRNDGGTSKLVRNFTKVNGKRSWFPRPSCGDDAMLWKEMFVSRTSGLTKAALVILGVSMVGVIGYFSYGFLDDAVHEIYRDGYLVYGSARRDFNFFLRGVTTAIYIFWFLGIASASASGLSSEREEDLWISLTSTPLSGPEILRAKMIGPIWGLRLVACLLFVLWFAGLVVGSIHPFGLAASLVEFAVFTWFLTALGTTFSLRAKNSTRALASTMALLIFLNGGYLFCCIPFQMNTLAIGAGSTPFLVWMSLLSVQDFGELSQDTQTVEVVAACILGVIAYGVAAAALTTWLFTSFDAVIDRPDRSRQDRTPNQQREYLKGKAVKESQYPNELA
jgi:ABC-type transport system involved in multi-copper enzyme maturation permease subunit